MFSKKRSLAKIAQLRSKKQIPSMDKVHSNEDAAPSPADFMADRVSSEESPTSQLSSTTERTELGEADTHLKVPAMRKTSASSSAPNLQAQGPTELTPLQLPKPPPSRRSPVPPRTRHLPSRNHSLKYSGGALHGSQRPCDFDHNYTEERVEDTVPDVGYEKEDKAFRRSVPDTDMRRIVLENQAAANHQLSSSYDEPVNDCGSKSRSPRRTQSMRVPPVVRLPLNTADASTSPMKRSPSARETRSRRRAREEVCYPDLIYSCDLSYVRALGVTG